MGIFNFRRNRNHTRASTFGLWSRDQIVPKNAQIKNPFSQHPYAHGAIRLAGQMLGGVPFQMVREDVSQRSAIADAQTRAELELALRKNRALQDLNPTRVRASDRPVQKVPGSKFTGVFETVNPQMARAELWQSVVSHLLTDGNAIVLWMGGAAKVMDERTVPTEAYVYGRSGWEFDENKQEWSIRTGSGIASKSEIYPAWQITHFRLYSPDSPFWGASPLLAATEKMNQDMLADGWNSAFLQNGAEPGGILKSGNDLSREDADRLRTIWESRHQGSGNKGKTAILTDGLDYDRNPTTHRDMEFSEMVRANREAILAALLVHKAALGVTDQLNRATITEARRMVWTNLLLPMAAYIEDRLFTSLFSRFDAGREFGAFDISGVPELQGDMNAKAQTAEILTRIGVPLNDAAQMLGLPLPSYDWGEQAYASASLVPFDQLKDPFKGLDEPEPARGEDSETRAAQGREESEADPRWSDWWRKVGEKTEKRFQSAMRRVIFEMRKDQLQRLEEERSSRTPMTVDDIARILFDADRWGKATANAARPLYQKTFQDSVRQLNEELAANGLPEIALGGDGTGPFAISDKAVLEFLERKEKKIKKVAKTIQDEVGKQLRAGVADGETIPQLAARVRTAFNGAAQPARTLRIARTETTSAANGVRFMGMKVAGVREKQWIAAPDARDTHQAASFEPPIKFGERFGNGLLHPGDPAGDASEVVNCRCTLVAGFIDPADVPPAIQPE